MTILKRPPSFRFTRIASFGHMHIALPASLSTFCALSALTTPSPRSAGHQTPASPPPAPPAPMPPYLHASSMPPPCLLHDSPLSWPPPSCFFFVASPPLCYNVDPIPRLYAASIGTACAIVPESLRCPRIPILFHVSVYSPVWRPLSPKRV